MSRGKFALIFTASVIVLLAASLSSQKHAFALSTGNDPNISFEGKVNTSAGVNITNGTYNMEYKIYSGGTATGGGTLLWTEDWLVSASNGVTFNGGTFQANLGSICAFSGGTCGTNTNTAINWNVYPLYLSLQIGNTSSCTITTSFNANCGGDGEMSPYILLTSTPYSFDAGLLGGLTSAQFAQLAAANLFQPSVATGNVTGVTVAQTLASSPTADIFDVDSYNGSSNVPVLQVTSGASINLSGGSGSSVTIGSQTASTINTVNIGATGASVNDDPVNIDTTTDTNAAGITIGGAGLSGAITLGQATVANTINIGNGAIATGTQTINIGSGATGSGLDVIAIGSAVGGLITLKSPTVLIGSSSASNTTQSLLQLNSNNTLTETATCSTTTNQGSMYYNTNSNTVRSCVNGSWQDIVTTQDFALQLFGVVPNSGNNPGDLVGASATATVGDNGGPCKTSWASTTSIYVDSCLAYSGGRLVSVPATTISIASIAASDYQNVCLNNAGVPVLMGTANTAAATATFNNLTATNGTTLGQPTLCIAMVKTSTTAGNIGAIYDARTFTTTTKTYATDTTASNIYPGAAVMPSGSGVVAATTSTTAQIEGVAVAYTGATAAAGVSNVIVAISGPQWVAASGGTVNDYIIPGTTGLTTAASATAPSAYDTFGIDQSTYGTSCSAHTYGATDCISSSFVYLTIQ
jgi:hypothetical protein